MTSLEASRTAGACRCGTRETGAAVASVLWNVWPTTTVSMAPPARLSMPAGSVSTSALPNRFETLVAAAFEPVWDGSK